MATHGRGGSQPSLTSRTTDSNVVAEAIVPRGLGRAATKPREPEKGRPAYAKARCVLRVCGCLPSATHRGLERSFSVQALGGPCGLRSG